MKESLENPSPESKENSEIKFHFTFVEHDRAEKAIERAAEIDKADIFGMEGVFTAQEKRAIQDVSDGTGKIPKDFLFSGGEFGQAELQLIKDTKKPVIFFDPSINNEIWSGYDDYEMKKIDAARLFEQGKFDEAMEAAKQNIFLEGELEIRRERIMQRQMLSQSKSKIEKYPHLKKAIEDGNGVNVVIVVGEAHTKIYRDMKKKGIPVTRTHSNDPVIFVNQEEGMRRVAEKLSISDELIARTLLEEAIYYRGGSINNPEGWRKITSHLMAEDIKRICLEVAGGKKIQGCIQGIDWDPNEDFEAKLKAFSENINQNSSEGE